MLPLVATAAPSVIEIVPVAPPVPGLEKLPSTTLVDCQVVPAPVTSILLLLPLAAPPPMKASPLIRLAPFSIVTPVVDVPGFSRSRLAVPRFQVEPVPVTV